MPHLSDAAARRPYPFASGSHMGFDATHQLPGGNYQREWPELVRMTDEAQRLVDVLRK